MQRWLGQPAARNGRVLIVAGEAGIGKTRLASETAILAEEQRMVVAQAACFEQDDLIPYAVFLDLLRTEPDLGRLRSNLTAATSIDPQEERRRITRSYIDQVAEIAAAGPALLILEDLHWCDEHSLEVIRGLARRAAECQLLLMLTYRVEEAPAAVQHVLADLERRRQAMEVDLSPLEPDDVDLFIRGTFGQAEPVRRDFLDAICTLTDGNPFFIEEVLGALVAGGDVFRRGGVWDRLPVHELRVPRTIHDAVQRRARLLSVAAQELLVAAAVVGRRFDFALLEQVTGHDESTLLRLVKELVTSHFVVEEEPDQFAFRHALTRQSVLVALLTRELRAWHARVAAAMEREENRSDDTAVAALARHYFEAGDWQQALAYAQRAGEQAQAVYAPRAAVEHFGRALEAVTHSSGVPPSRLLRARGQAYETLGQFEAAEADYEAALAQSRAAGDRHGEWQSLMDLGFLWAARDYARVGLYFDQALAQARAQAEPALIARSLNRVGNWLVNTGRPRDALPLHEEALAIFEATTDRSGIAETMDLLGLAAGHSGDAFRAVECYERAATLFRELENRRGLVSSLVMLAQMGTDHPGSAMAMSTVDAGVTIRRANEAVAIARSLDWRAGEAFALVGQAYCLTGRGEYGRAVQAARTALAIAEEIEHHQWMLASHLSLASVYLELHAPELTHGELDRAQVIVDAVGSAYWTALVTAVRAGACLMQGDLDRVDALIHALAVPERAPMNPAHMIVLRGQVELALASGRGDRALAIIDELVSTATPGVADFISPYVWLLRGEALRRMGRAEQAEAVLRPVVDAASSRGSWPLVWRARVTLGRLAQAQGRRAEAAREFDAARTIIERLAADVPGEPEPALGGTSLRAHFLTSAMAQLPRRRPATALRQIKAVYGGLTTREREVAALIARGKSNREIAETLVLGNRTVQTHIGNIFAKLGFSSRAQIAAWAVEKGLTISVD